MVRNGGLGGLYTRPPPLRESFPRAMVRTVPPPQGAGVVRETLLLVTYVMYAVVGMGLPHPNIWEEKN
jgi:hypothetical protein